MSVENALAEGRAAALARMTETVRVGTAVDGTDPETGDATTVLADVVYGGDDGAPGRIKYVAETVSDSSVAGQVVATQSPVLSVPTGTARIDEGLAVEVVASRVDAILIGRMYRIAGSPDSGSTTAHRYPLTELT